MLLHQQIESAPRTAHKVTRISARLTAQMIEDKPSDLPNQGSLFPCPLQFAGCQTPCGNTNEWKRHVSTKHLRHLIFRCAEGSCATGTARRNWPRHDTLMEHTSKQHGGKAKYEVLRAEAPSSLPCFVEGCKESFSGWRWYTDLLEHWLGHTMDAKCHDVFSREPGQPNGTAFVDFGIERGFIARDETGRLQCPRRPSGTHYHVVERRYTKVQESACSCGWTGTVGSKTRHRSQRSGCLLYLWDPKPPTANDVPPAPVVHSPTAEGWSPFRRTAWSAPECPPRGLTEVVRPNAASPNSECSLPQAREEISSRSTPRIINQEKKTYQGIQYSRRWSEPFFGMMHVSADERVFIDDEPYILTRVLARLVAA